MNQLEDLFGLSGKTAIITGASRGLGRTAAIALNAVGAHVILFGRDAEMLRETLSLLPAPERAKVIEGNVNSDADRIAAISEVTREFGKIDVLVNNAGIIHRNPALEYTPTQWNEVIQTDLTSVFHWSQDVAKEMQRSGSGKIINVASLLSFSGGINAVGYAAAKGGVAQLTKALANELAKYNINVNAIAPGYFNTEATEGLRNNQVRFEHVLSRIPAGRFAEPEELAGAFIFLASHASDYMNGHILTIDGGFNSY
jgi:2-deoxy-D-gluconate 3-dehydrogenase